MHLTSYDCTGGIYTVFILYRELCKVVQYSPVSMTYKENVLTNRGNLGVHTSCEDQGSAGRYTQTNLKSPYVSQCFPTSILYQFHFSHTVSS